MEPVSMMAAAGAAASVALPRWHCPLQEKRPRWEWIYSRT